MGIPSLFRNLIKNDETLLSTNFPLCDHLYLDYNCLIHYVAHREKFTTSQTIVEKEEQVIASVIKYTRYIVNDLIKPRELLYIAMDGPVPMAKMCKQRERRYKKFLDEHIEQQIYKSFEEESPIRMDSNVITPCTEFMKKLHDRIYSMIKLKVFHTTEVIFSDSSQNGEGETKIFEHIRNLFFLKRTVVYGLDADLIVLCLANNRIDISLCREIESGELNIFNLRQAMHGLFVKYDLQREYKNRKHDLVLDIVLVLMFGGNDFVPPIECYKIRNNGWHNLLHLYSTNQVRLVQHKTIVWEEFHRFIQILSSSEDRINKGNYKKMTFKSKQEFERPTNVKDAIALYYNDPFFHPHHPLHHVYGDAWKTIRYNTNHDTWKSQYYANSFDSSTNMVDVCANYYESIIWCWNYYVHGIVTSWLFYYKYDVAPCISDVSELFSHILLQHPRSFLNDYGKTIDVDFQWKVIMPSDNVDPMSISLNALHNHKIIYTPPILPSVDIQRMHFEWCINRNQIYQHPHLR